MPLEARTFFVTEDICLIITVLFYNYLLKCFHTVGLGFAYFYALYSWIDHSLKTSGRELKWCQQNTSYLTSARRVIWRLNWTCVQMQESLRKKLCFKIWGKWLKHERCCVCIFWRECNLWKIDSWPHYLAIMSVQLILSVMLVILLKQCERYRLKI